MYDNIIINFLKDAKNTKIRKTLDKNIYGSYRLQHKYLISHIFKNKTNNNINYPVHIQRIVEIQENIKRK